MEGNAAMVLLQPKGNCLGWNPFLVWTFAGSEIILCLVLVVISLLHLRVVVRVTGVPGTGIRGDVVDRLVRAIFAGSLAAAFASKAMTMWWTEAYWVNAGADLVADVTAVVCVLILWRSGRRERPTVKGGTA